MKKSELKQLIRECVRELNESLFKKIQFSSHKDYNPNADIIEGKLDDDIVVAYGVIVNGKGKGKEFMWYYSGPIHSPSSQRANNFSKYFEGESNVPKKYKKYWLELKTIYDKKSK